MPLNALKTDAPPMLRSFKPQDDVAGQRGGRGRYASDSMLARRRRMLDAAKEMIAEGCPDGFTIRELGRRAGVSVTTIYATYGDKEGLIAAAISDYYDQLSLAHAPERTTLEEILAATDQARDAMRANKAYARQYADLYFSSTVDPRVYAAIRDTTLASAGYLAWLEDAFSRGDVIEGLSRKQIATLLANSRLTMMHDWLQGRVSDDEVGPLGKRLFLVFARSISRGATLAAVEAELDKLNLQG